MKNLVLRNLFKPFRLAVTLASLRYVPTNLNCADDANKGQQAKVLASERRWCSRPEFMPLETSYSHCDELGILRDSRRLDRTELPYDAAHGSPHDLPNCFMPVSTCGSSKSILGHRLSAGGEELGQRMRCVWEKTCWLSALQLEQCI